MASCNVPVSFPQPRDLLSRTSDDAEDNKSPQTAPPLTRKSRTRIATAGGGTDIDAIPQKPRGRPPGSKNKPKPAVVVTKETDISAMKSAVLEIAAGSDIIDTVAQFARRHQLSVTVISGSGSVSNVTLRHPTSHAPSLSLRGPFKLISLTGTFLGSSSSSSSSASSSFGISLAGHKGQVIGGVVGGKVTAASTVVLVVATFTKPSYHKLSGETEEAKDQPRPRVGGGGGHGGGANVCYSGTSMSLSTNTDPIMASAPTPSNCHAAPEVMNWTTAPPRPPKPY